MRLWLDPDRLAGAEPHGRRRGRRRCASRTCRWRPGRSGSRRRSAGQMYQISVRAVGRLTEPAEFDDIILKRVGGRHARPPQGRRPRRSSAPRTTRPTCATTAATPSASASCSCRRPTRCRCTATSARELDRLSKQLSARAEVELAFDTTRVVSESIREVVTTLLEAIGLVMLVMFLFLQNWRTTLIPAITIPGVARRHVRVREAVRLLDQHADALRHHARHRPRRRRCDRRDREHRAPHPRRPPPPAEAASTRDGRGDGRRDRDGARAGRGVRAGRVLPGHDRPAVPAVRADDRLLDGDLGVQRADADAGARGVLLAQSRKAEGPVLPRRQPGDRRRDGVRWWRRSSGSIAPARRSSRSCSSALLGATYWVLQTRADAGSCPTRTRATSSSSSRRRRAPRSTTRWASRSRSSRCSRSTPEVKHVFGVGGFSFGAARARTRASCSRC